MADGQPLTLRLQRVLPGTRERVFRGCTEPEDLEQWWGPHGFTTPHVELDLRVGGRYRFAMQPPDGEVFHLSGEFRAVDPPARLEYTFRWEPPDPDDRETVVTVSLRDLGESTEFDLVQSGFATEERLALHDGGWADSLERLQDLLSSPEARD
ncbi:MAG TPA: SRPBCC domain-containing protein [Acidimicrobiia bacterium]|nr:SRPBCC domain-containing protein [Acidimicrobiia bacterium]